MKKENKLMMIFLLCFPFIDFITSIATWENFFSIGLLIKSIFLLFAVFYLLKHSSSKKKIFLLFSVLILYGMIDIFILMNKPNINMMSEISNLIKIFYLPTLLLFSREYQNSKINKRTITLIFLFYLLLYLVPFPFGLGHNIQEIYPNKDLYLSYFYIGNELVNVFILLIPIVIAYFIEHKSILWIPFLLLTLAMVLLLGTKTMYLSLLIITIFFFIYERQKIRPFIKKNWIKILIPIIILGIGLTLYLPKSSIYQNVKTSIEYYKVDDILDLFSYTKIDQVIYSNRLTFLKNINEEYMNSNLTDKLFGIGRTKINQIKDIEIDIFDIFYSIGIIGFIIYLGYFIIVLKTVKLKPLYIFVFLLLGVISLFSGHVLISPMVSTYLGLLPLISKND